MSASRFYDQYVDYHVQSGINDRIYSLYRRILKLGLRKDENILEIGCGIGALTFLLSKKVKKGGIEAFDPSSKSIELAVKKVKQSNIHFSIGDVLTYSAQPKFFDKIILFDVLEHIPIGHHDFVFGQIATWLKDDGYLLINIPNPDYILYDQIHQPQTLQEVDQPVFLHHLLPKLVNAGLELINFDIHSVWVKEDYHFLVVRRKKTFQEMFLHAERGVFRKGMLWMQRNIRRLKDPFH